MHRERLVDPKTSARQVARGSIADLADLLMILSQSVNLSIG